MIALRKLEGYANQEIARSLDCSLRSMGELAIIRATWAQADEPPALTAASVAGCRHG